MRLAQRAAQQATRFGASFFTGSTANGLSVSEHGGAHVVHTDGGDLQARAVVIATGVAYRRLGVAAVENLVGRGVYCGSAMTIAKQMQDAEVIVVGRPRIHPHPSRRPTGVLGRRAATRNSGNQYGGHLRSGRHSLGFAQAGGFSQRRGCLSRAPRPQTPQPVMTRRRS